MNRSIVAKDEAVRTGCTHTEVDAKIYLTFAAGRKPDAACCPGAGLMAGCGPKRGLKGMLFLTGGGAFGFVDVTNWGFVRLRHVLNSTVEPRYCEHLIRECVKNIPRFKGRA